MKEITKTTRLAEVQRTPLRTIANPDLKLRKGGWYYDNRGGFWKVICLRNNSAVVLGVWVSGDGQILDTEISDWFVSWQPGDGWVLTSTWYLIDELSNVPGVHKLKSIWLEDPSWNDHVLKVFENSGGYEKKDWAPCYCLPSGKFCLPHSLERGENDE